MDRSPLYGSLTGLLALDVLLQGVWAGIFLEHDGRRDQAHAWITAHNVGGAVAVALAVLTLVVAVLRLRARRDLVVGSLAAAVLVAAQYGIGQAITDGGQDWLTAVHVPLALAVMALVTWLPLRARVGRTMA